METQPPENIPINGKKVINKLVQGREFATQLQFLLNNPDEDFGSVSADDLVEKIVGSFTEALSVLNSGGSPENLMNSGVSSPCCADRSEDSGESRKGPALKDRRGGYKRKKTSHTWTKVTATPIEDGHAWRKYGQKVILNAKYPRSYYRCTHKNDQGCQAIKQVQRTEDEPSMYKTIYIGHHTCEELLQPSHLIFDSTPSKDSFQISFGPHVLTKPIEQQYPSFFPNYQPLKQECKEEILLTHLTHNNYHHSSPEYLFSPDLGTFQNIESTGPNSDTGEVISGVYSSCTTSSPSFDMEIMVDPVDFDEVFRFDDEIYEERGLSLGK